MAIYYKLVLLAIVSIFFYFLGYSQATHSYQDEYVAQLEKNKKLEEYWSNRQHQLIIDYDKQIEEIQNASRSSINAITDVSLRDTTKCTPRMHKHVKTASTVSRETIDKSNLICYTKEQLLQKIRETMAIGTECDQLAIKYNTLLRVCNAEIQ